MPEISAYTGMVMQWLLTPIIWIILFFVFIFVSVGILWIRKKRRLMYPTVEIVDLGNGKMGFNLFKSGWFGKKQYFKNLIHFGGEVLKTKDGETIEEFSSEDFQEVNGKRGVICYRDPLNPKILVPINHLYTKNKNLVAEIAPASYRDTAISIIKTAEEETRDKWANLVQWMIFGGVIIFALVSIIVITQMVKNGQAEASKLIVDAGDTCLKNAQEICGQICSALNSNAP